MSKRFTALLMAIVLMVGVLAVPAMAATGGGTVSPQACSHPVKDARPVYGPWLATGSYACIHGYAPNRDETQTRSVYLDIYCRYCNVYMGRTSTTPENRIFCLAQNRVCTHDHEIM